MKADVASGSASYQTAVILRTAASACVREREKKKINEHGAVGGSVSFAANALHITGVKEKSAVAGRTECQMVQRVKNAAQSGAILRVTPKYEVCFNAAGKKNGRLLWNNGEPRSRVSISNKISKRRRSDKLNQRGQEELGC